MADIIHSTKKVGRPKGSTTNKSLAIERAQKRAEEVKEHPPLIPGDLWKVRLGEAMLNQDRTLRVVSSTHDTVKFAEVPPSSFEPEYKINKIKFIEKVKLD